ncbi:MAG: radical SAM protein [Thermodesulfobacteriota bacterium]
MNQSPLKFEQGPIRPPNESRSLLLRFTRNCPWNQCLFCPVYKGRKFSLRSVEEIKADIQKAKDMADEIRAISWNLGHHGKVNDAVISHIMNQGGYSASYQSVAIWLYYGTGACFLQDADNLIMRTDDLVEVLKFLREKFPEIIRVTTYSRAKTVTHKSLESLKRIREAGLNRVHIGLETGYDPLLKLMKKGVTAEQHVEAGRRVIDAGMELSEYVMPGLGGKEMWAEHARATAQALNKINPHFIRLRSLRIPPHVPLYAKLQDGSFTLQTDDEIAEEIRLFVKTLDGITSTLTSDHIMNLLEEVSGTFPKDKDGMLDIIEKYQNLPVEDRLIYRIGRRGGTYQSTDDLKRDPETYRKIKTLLAGIRENEGEPGVEKFISEMGDRYI